MAKKNNGGFLTSLGATILILIVAYPVIAFTLIIIAVLGWICFHDFKTNNGFISTITPRTNDNTNHYEKGLKLSQEKKYEEAITEFNFAIANPSSLNVPIDDVYVMRGIAYSNLGRNNQAIADFNTAIKMFSIDNSTAFLERGKVYMKEKKYNLALKDINNAMKRNFYNNGDDFYYRALLYLKTNKEKEALKDLKEAIRLLPNNKKDVISSCQFLLEKIENKIKEEEYLTKNNSISPKEENKKIQLLKCSKTEILSLDGFNEEKANNFIEERAKGLMWYNIDSFANAFNLQPHELIMIQDKIIFPPKPKHKNKYRKIDI